MLGRVIREIGRFALAKVDQVTNTIQVHRLVQAVIRAQLTEEEQREARHVVHRCWPGAGRTTTSRSTTRRTGRASPSSGRTSTASDARNCKDAGTRRLLIDRVRYLWKRGDFRRRASARAEELRRPLEGDARRATIVQYLYLRFHLANMLRSQGRYVEAQELDDVTAGSASARCWDVPPAHVRDHLQPRQRPGRPRRLRRRWTWRPRGARRVQPDLPRVPPPYPEPPPTTWR